MQTILGANGIIGEELARELRKNYTQDIKLVGRNPTKVHPDDIIFSADLMNVQSVIEALENTTIAYLTVGLPYDSEIWLRNWKIVIKNVIEACKLNDCKLVYFDNTYAYPQDVSIQVESTPMHSEGKKGRGKKLAAEVLLKAIDSKEIEAVICRAPEFYGPGKTKGLTNMMVFESLRDKKEPKVFLRDDKLRTLIYTPDASKAMALIGNTADAYGQTWHLPCDDDRLTYEQFFEEISSNLGRKIKYKILSSLMLKAAALVDKNMKETTELLPRYEIDNIFVSAKFKERFPDFKVTSYQEGIANIIKDFGIK